VASIVDEARENIRIGLKYSSISDTFHWVSGEEVTYTMWAADQPGRTTKDFQF